MTARGDPKPAGLHYSLELEYALNEFFGSEGRWKGLAGAFAQPKMARKAFREATRAIRRRLSQIITVDDRLQLLTAIRLDALERAASRIDENGGGLLEVSAELLYLGLTSSDSIGRLGHQPRGRLFSDQ